MSPHERLDTARVRDHIKVSIRTRFEDRFLHLIWSPVRQMRDKELGRKTNAADQLYWRIVDRTNTPLRQMQPGRFSVSQTGAP